VLVIQPSCAVKVHETARRWQAAEDGGRLVCPESCERERIASRIARAVPSELTGKLQLPLKLDASGQRRRTASSFCAAASYEGGDGGF